MTARLANYSLRYIYFLSNYAKIAKTYKNVRILNQYGTTVADSPTTKR